MNQTKRLAAALSYVTSLEKANRKYLSAALRIEVEHRLRVGFFARCSTIIIIVLISVNWIKTSVNANVFITAVNATCFLFWPVAMYLSDRYAARRVDAEWRNIVDHVEAASSDVYSRTNEAVGTDSEGAS